MRPTHASVFGRRRGLVCALVVILVALTACTNTADDDAPTEVPHSSNSERASLDQKLSRYLGGLRVEFDWLWDRANIARTNGRPTDDVCSFPDFDIKPVTMSDDHRTRDDVGAIMVDQLDYVATLLEQSNSEWREFCNFRVNAGEAVVFMDPRLSQAYQELNVVEKTLEKRAESRDH
jgi:hypothetical protein